MGDTLLSLLSIRVFIAGASPGVVFIFIYFDLILDNGCIYPYINSVLGKYKRSLKTNGRYTINFRRLKHGPSLQRFNRVSGWRDCSGQ